MNIPKQTGPMLWGVFIGAVACAIVGFTWGGWVTGSSARKDVAVAKQTATVAALAPLCAKRFHAQPNAEAKMAALTQARAWERTDLVEKSGFAILPDGKSDSDIARACVDILLAPAKS